MAIIGYDDIEFRRSRGHPADVGSPTLRNPRAATAAQLLAR
jgi:hypothetical protein